MTTSTAVRVLNIEISRTSQLYGTYGTITTDQQDQGYRTIITFVRLLPPELHACPTRDATKEHLVQAYCLIRRPERISKSGRQVFSD